MGEFLSWKHCGNRSWAGAFFSALCLPAWLTAFSDGRASALRGGRRLKLLRMRTRLETAVALSAGVLGILTIFWHDWIEALTGWDPDHHNGSVEWILVVGLVAVAVTMAFAARRHWRLLAAYPGQ